MQIVRAINRIRRITSVEDLLLLPPLLFFPLICLFEAEPRPRSDGGAWAVHAWSREMDTLEKTQLGELQTAALRGESLPCCPLWLLLSFPRSLGFSSLSIFSVA